MVFQISVCLKYSDIFDDYDKVSINDFFKDIPTQNSIEVIGHFLAQVHTYERNSQKQIEFIRQWINRLPNAIKTKAEAFIKDSIRPYSEYNYINNVSGLILIDYIIQNANSLPKLASLTEEQELNLFKAYLYASQKWIDEQDIFWKGNPDKDFLKSEESLIKVLIPIQIPYQEILEMKDFRLQFIKAIYYFKFCETHSDFKDFLKVFLAAYNLPSWNKYLSHLLSLYVDRLDAVRRTLIHVDNSFPDVIEFLNLLSIQSTTYVTNPDFKGIRELPIFKVNSNDFIFLNLNFLVDKLFQGIQFDFFNVLYKNKATYKGNDITKFPDFKSIYGENFSEVVLFYSVMRHAFANKKYLRFEGEQIKANGIIGEPDYYIRDKSKVYLFEFKDVLINAVVKHSYNFDTIMAEIFNKVVFDTKKKKGEGITQLVNSIEKIKQNVFSKFDNYSPSEMIIYPILVTTDFTFNLGGINYVLNKEFKKQIAERGLTDLTIKDLVLIDLDTLIKFQDLFKTKTLTLNNCLNEYYEYIKDRKDIFKRISSFSMFLHNKTSKMKYDTPQIMMKEVESLLQ